MERCPRGLVSAMMLSVLVGATASATGCYRDSDDFNAKAASYMCRYNDRDPDSPFLDHTRTDENGDPPPYEGPWCEEAVTENLGQCSEQCDYSPRKARRCLRRLRRAVKKKSYDESLFAVCERVYECPDETEIEDYDACRITTESCSVSNAPLPVGFAVLALMGLWARRRRDA